MASQAFTDLNAFQSAVDAETTRIASEVQKLLDGMQGGLTADEAATLIAQGEPLVANLKAIASGGPVVPTP